jgi:DNA-binding NarL/FixJ family response regulator
MRILIVDDHPIVASGCRALLAGRADVEILEAADAASGEGVFVAERPDICIVDINLPGVSGFELARRLLVRDAAARIIMFSMNDDPIFAARAIETGAKGYVSKSGDPGDLVEAINRVGEGGVFLPPAIAQSIAFAGPGLRLLGTGKSLSEIAWLINASYKTIANTSSIMRQKLGLRSSAELVRFAIESGLA